MATEKQKKHVWDKASKIKGKDPNVWRKDSKGNPIKRDAHGTDGKHGWEVDHKTPKAKGGTNRRSNLQALQTDANRRKADK